MLDYETYCQIHDHLGRQKLTVAQTARALALSPRTVAKWAAVQQFRPRSGVARVSKLDAFKGQIVRWRFSSSTSPQVRPPRSTGASTAPLRLAPRAGA